MSWLAMEPDQSVFQQVINIAPDGDVILVVGPSRSQISKLRVHSLFLTTASKVFSAMFGPHFKEGNVNFRWLKSCVVFFLESRGMVLE